jgi:peptidyl-tRNA hydrolase, PTH1 family
MPYIIVGLGNPGEEYVLTRHNTGRIALDAIRSHYEGEDFVMSKKSNALVSDIIIGKKKEKATLLAPETFMNKSGSSVATVVKSVKAAEKLIVIYDDFQLPLGRIRISYNRSSGGHNGLESIIKAVKTEAFVRIRIGVSPENAQGVAKVPHGEDKVEKFILGKFKDDELKEIKKLSIRVAEAIEIIITESREKAMSVYNAG